MQFQRRTHGKLKMAALCVLVACTFAEMTAPLSASHLSSKSGSHVHIGDSVAALTGPWKFHIGDSPIDRNSANKAPLWAEPGFDDSSWESADPSPDGEANAISGAADFVHGWTMRGHPGYSGYAWYRLTVHTETHEGARLALAGPSDVDDAYQFFENGALKGSFGDFSQTLPEAFYAPPRVFDLSAQTTDSDEADGKEEDGEQKEDEGVHNSTRTLAFRVWMSPYTLTVARDVGGLHTAPLLGERHAIATASQTVWDRLIWSYFTYPIQFVVFAVLALLILSLQLFDRTDRVYLWIGLLFLLLSEDGLVSSLAVWSSHVSGRLDVILEIVIGHSLEYGIWVMIWRAWFRQRRPRWAPAAVAPLVLLLMVATMFSRHCFETPYSDQVTNAFTQVTLLVRFALAAMMLGSVIRGIRDQGVEGWLALPAVLLAIVSEFYSELQMLRIVPFWFIFGVRIRITEITNLLLVLVLGILLLRRLLRSLERQRQVALDLKQAHELQRVLIPESLPAIPNFTLTSAYRPVLEVGGDFFQVVPVQSGAAGQDESTLILLGDVSGKGLRAAMAVSLIVGLIRAFAESTSSPAELLARLNRRLEGRLQGGFATCIALRLDPAGACTLASAGHTPPFLNGREIELPGALPLGLAAQAVYEEKQVTLAAGDQLNLYTDGLLEARSATGELYGFERLQVLFGTQPNAARAADAAVTFGQDDDITVLTLVRLPA
jgi:hypothetical protein